MILAAPALLAALVAGVNPHLDDGRKLVANLQYEDAERALRLAKHVAQSTPEEKREAFALLAWVLSGLGKTDECELAYRELLTFAPDYAPPDDAPPKLIAVFRHAKEAVYPPDFIRLTQLPTLPGRLEVQLVDPWKRIDEVVVMESPGGDVGYSPRALQANGRRWAGTISGEVGQGTRWYVEARSKGAVLGTLGSSGQPFLYEPTVASAPPPAPISAPTPAAAVTEPVEVRPARPMMWTGWGIVAASAVAAGFGVWSTVESTSAFAAAGRSTRAPDVTALDDRANVFGTRAVLLFAGAALGALVGGLLIWFGS